MDNLDPDLVGSIVISLAAFGALCVMAPRWDTGSGAVLILTLGYLALPVIGLCVVAGAIWIFVGYPLWQLSRLVRRIARS
jgi:hypothetical protein